MTKIVHKVVNKANCSCLHSLTNHCCPPVPPTRSNMESAGFERDRRLKMTVKINRSSSYSRNDEGDITMTPPILTYSRCRLFARLRPAHCPGLHCAPPHCAAPSPLFAFVCCRRHIHADFLSLFLPPSNPIQEGRALHHSVRPYLRLPFFSLRLLSAAAAGGRKKKAREKERWTD